MATLQKNSANSIVAGIGLKLELLRKIWECKNRSLNKRILQS
jgi:hypothetical protein